MHNVLRESLDPEDRGGSRQRRVDKHNTQVLTIRSQWQLKLLHKLKDKCEGWRHAAGLKAKELVWEDAARAVCVGVGMLARVEEKNEGAFVL